MGLFLFVNPYLCNMKIVFDSIQYKETILALIKAGEDPEEFEHLDNFVVKNVMIDPARVETAIEHPHFKNHTIITTYNDDQYTVKYNIIDFCRLVEHIDANKLLCKLRN